ncbi:MAG: DsbA family protein [Proteobacteria bacterium]|nr:DsbA family protein [Pseudomonadota bacterium]
MPSRVDVFWSFRSPYSYLATPRLVDIGEHWDVDLCFRPVLPMAIRIPDGFAKVNPKAFAYIRNDAERVAGFLGLDFSFPDPDPVVFVPETRRAAAEQPYIYRLTRLGIAATEQGRGLPFAQEISRTIWSGRIKDWYRDEQLNQAAKCAGLQLDQLEAQVEADTDRIDGIIAANGDALAQSGHWGVPTVVFQGEPFFGQDRLDVLCWRLAQCGVAHS